MCKRAIPKKHRQLTGNWLPIKGMFTDITVCWLREAFDFHKSSFREMHECGKFRVSGGHNKKKAGEKKNRSASVLALTQIGIRQYYFTGYIAGA